MSSELASHTSQILLYARPKHWSVSGSERFFADPCLDACGPCACVMCDLLLSPALSNCSSDLMLLPRMTLVEEEHFGSAAESVQQRLDTAYNAFSSFCKSRKISCSQPPFTEKMVPWPEGYNGGRRCMFLRKDYELVALLMA